MIYFLDLVDPTINVNKYNTNDFYIIVGALAILVILFGTLAVVKKQSKNN